jgi:capsular polysaccharide transport system permease protein
VLLPAAAGTYYYGWTASDRFAASAGFAVRSIDQGSGIDGIGALTGMASSGSTTSDSYIVLRYLESRDLLEQLQQEMNLRAVFSDSTLDPISRLDAAVPIEDFVDYWGGMITTSFETSSSIVSFEVETFSPESAKELADRVLGHVQALINDLSERARADSLRFAIKEVTVAEKRLRNALAAVRVFRERERSINPAATAQLDIELLSALDAKLINIHARMAAISSQVDDNAPSMVLLGRQAEALEEQIAKRTAEVATSDAPGASVGMSNLLAAYETLEVEKRFAESAYASALTSLEQARIEAGRQQRYLAIYSFPAKPEGSIYPERVQNSALIAALALMSWGIGTLVVYSIRDHMS